MFHKLAQLRAITLNQFQVSATQRHSFCSGRRVVLVENGTIDKNLIDIFQKLLNPSVRIGAGFQLLFDGREVHRSFDNGVVFDEARIDRLVEGHGIGSAEQRQQNLFAQLLLKRSQMTERSLLNRDRIEFVAIVLQVRAKTANELFGWDRLVGRNVVVTVEHTSTTRRLAAQQVSPILANGTVVLPTTGIVAGGDRSWSWRHPVHQIVAGRGDFIVDR